MGEVYFISTGQLLANCVYCGNYKRWDIVKKWELIEFSRKVVIIFTKENPQQYLYFKLYSEELRWSVKELNNYLEDFCDDILVQQPFTRGDIDQINRSLDERIQRILLKMIEEREDCQNDKKNT